MRCNAELAVDRRLVVEAHLAPRNYKVAFVVPLAGPVLVEYRGS
jgi:hypothetical protein